MTTLDVHLLRLTQVTTLVVTARDIQLFVLRQGTTLVVTTLGIQLFRLTQKSSFNYFDLSTFLCDGFVSVPLN